jgi:ketosteroid isomerase-like protein
MSTQRIEKVKSTQEVLHNHLHSFGRGDLDGILSDYATDAILFTQDGPLKGRDAIRPLFVAMLAEFGKPGARFNLRQQSVEGDYAFIVWTAETADNVYELATDTLHVRGGKIAAQSFASNAIRKVP